MTGEWERTLAGQLVEAGLGRAEADGLARDAAEEASRRRGEWRSFRDAVERVVSGATADAGSEESN